ncbi:MAG: NAD(P)H-binding protein, partial [Desulfovibrionaceae bacterium]|nr:NAD(P)H-binding protein [Desulfovibrionaceae bacterium]
MSEDRAPVLVTGATGYVGGRLVPALLERGHRVRAAGRSVAKIKARPWGGHPGLEAVQADLLDPSSMLEAARGCSAAYYLVHSMRPDVPDFAARDREAACNMARAASQAGMKRIIYLGGLGEDSPELSPHLRSRAEVGRILSLGSAELTVLRAAVILGSGSASFEIIRYLADRLPVIIAPKWVRTRCQPIAVSNVLGYLVGCLENPATAGRSFDIGGPDILTYAEMLRIYAEKAGLRPRLIIPAPLLTPGMSAFWINLVTPVPMSLIRPLVQGLKNEVVCRENDIRRLVPQRLLSCGEAMAQALDKVRQQSVSTCCFDAGSACLPGWAACQDPPYAGGAVHQCNYSARLRGPAERGWRPVQGLGGESGWFFGSFLWRLRGLA